MRNTSDIRTEQRCDSCGQPLRSWGIDKLTGLLNRWGWDDLAPSTLVHARAQGEMIALLLVDLDRFKRINDTFGHLTGDAVLREVATVLREVTDEADLAGRFGGDEFMVLLPSTDIEVSLTLARDIHEKVRAVSVSGAQPSLGAAAGCSASIGLVFSGSWHDVDLDVDALLQNADAALLAAKRSGGGRTCVARAYSGRARQYPRRQLMFDPPLLPNQKAPLLSGEGKL